MVKGMKGRERIGSSLADQLGPSALVVYTSSFTVSQSIWCDHSDKSPSLEFSKTAVCFQYYYFTTLKKIKDFDFESIVLTGTINLANKDLWRLLTVLNSELSQSRHSNNVCHHFWCESSISGIPIVPGCGVERLHQRGLGVGIKVLTIPDLRGRNTSGNVYGNFADEKTTVPRAIVPFTSLLFYEINYY